MCGIGGVLAKTAGGLKNVHDGLSFSLHHRGPDGDGHYSFENATLVHRRLAIIDLEGGKQPLSNEDGSCWITFNGEIYNFREIRQELESRGHSFRTHSDTEVIVHAYEEWGAECINHLRGMFAFCILDQRRRELFLARDHFGIKPLLYLDSPGLFAFASELGALSCIPGIALDFDFTSIDRYFQFQYIPAPHTAYKQIKKLPAAHYLRVSLDGNIIELKRYWQLEFKPGAHRNESQWLEEFDAVLADSVQAHLVSDVPFGAFLSGGVDSSMVVAYMARIMKQPVKTFSIGFEEKDFNELDYARYVAKKWNTDHHEQIVKPDAIGILPTLVRHYGEPFADSSAIPTYYVSQLARQHVTMVLTGDAGDEIFAGYDSYTSRWKNHISPVPEHLSGAKRALYPLANQLMPRKFSLRSAGISDWLRYCQALNQNASFDLWRREVRGTLDKDRVQEHEKYFALASSWGHFQKVQFTDFNTYMVDDILAKVDVASMIHSLETRTPLLDHKVIEFASTIPEKLNISRLNGVWAGKLLFKKLGERFYEKPFLYRKKMGFAVPVKHWFGSGSEATVAIMERLLDRNNPLYDYLDSGKLEKHIRKGHGPMLWSLLFFQEWIKQNKQG